MAAHGSVVVLVMLIVLVMLLMVDVGVAGTILAGNGICCSDGVRVGAGVGDGGACGYIANGCASFGVC